MYAQYAYNIGTQAELLSDIVAILTGTTDKESLSATCNKPDTTITSVVTSGWTVHDADAGTNKVCIKSEVYDTPGTYKYVVVDTSATTNVKLTVYGTWSNVSHTGTLLVNGSDSNSVVVNVTTISSVLHVFASPNMVVLHGVANSTGLSSSSLMVLERERFIADTDPTFCATTSTAFSTNATAVYLPYVQLVFAKMYAAEAVMYSSTTIQGTSASENTAVVNINGSVKVPMGSLLIYPDAKTGSVPYGNLTSLTDIWCLPRGSMPPLYKFAYSGKNYIVMSATAGTVYALRAE